MSTATQVRVRYAPSPTGHLHIGGARTALFNYLYARHHGGEFIVRIEDTDVKRNKEGGDVNQLHYLKWLGIEWDESIDIGGPYGPYRQTERLDIYKQYWEQLLNQGHAYRCYCTEEELDKEREEQAARGETPRYSRKCLHLSDAQREALAAEGRQPSVRFLVPDGKSYAFTDMVKGDISFDTNDIGDFVIVKKDGIPTYNFAVVVDDYLMKITHVLRGQEHISNTPRQLMLYEALGWEVPQFGHMSLITNEERKKLSKRDETAVQFIEQYEQLGFLPEALFNFIGLLGWSPVGEEEVFSREQFISIFDASRLSRSPAVFDTDKLHWLNGQYWKKADPDRLAGICIPHLQKAGYLPAEPDPAQKEWALLLTKLYQDRIQYGAQIVDEAKLFFTGDIAAENDEAAAILNEDYAPVVLGSLLSQVERAGEWAPEHMKGLLKAVQAETGYKGKQLFMTTRVALTGQMHGPDLDMTMYLLGKDKVAQRLRKRL
ncbi:glutamyl-tRNA synthetase [Gordoniibacillus kamchatkensis]|uniref:Glutamate--tRNA ligase n=1 Tax=Gordoniibacillus kamchatkensis TaxID=1590651 RepID=A0ABR5ABG4_9BACL|nr:glutamate--tRNA ligase [Paenibacillus sp. VKM B-2647]KIL38399.1 glutamyl-tRNA synthetase [Paenibacillus sp. VKM B-2647]